MEIKSDSWTVVIVGLWNTYIFSADWLANTLFNRRDLTLEFLIASGKPQVRFSTDQIIFAAAEDKVVIAAKDTSQPTLVECERLAKKLVEELPHTPITGIGVNMGFAAPELHNIGAVFQFTDTVQLSAAGCVIEQTDIKRTLSTDVGIVNLRTVYGGTNAPEIHFNFHRDIVAADELPKKLDALTDKVWAYRNTAFQLMSDVYGLTLDEGE